ncbi:hypothetical protein N0V93_005784 [Gnomoniopsis smithogilvyi]|uniref:Uncharacterized protein n=1 Tax=Gnomoniopsis smithogilvyi TaxID=1191159 RepID=A0A9W8YV51_9PEZI|nr:hypothetical protein N0V93_005784 [Gnomoniopsis smithogilvyi]
MANGDFNFDLAEPLQTTTTRHQRNFSASLLSNIKFEPRTLEQREADAKRNAPKYAREKAVNSILTARFLKAKKTFDGYYSYNIDEAWDGEAGEWREEKDPWLRLGTQGEEKTVMEEFLRGFTKDRKEAQEEGTEREPLSADELEALALAVVRVAKKDLEAAGRETAALGDDFKKSVVEIVAQLQTEFSLPQSAPEVEEVEEEEEEETEHVNGVNGA